MVACRDAEPSHIRKLSKAENGAVAAKRRSRLLMAFAATINSGNGREPHLN
jgi:hypothetical protein